MNFRGVLRFYRWARIIVPVAVMVIGSVAGFVSGNLERLPFVGGDAPVHNLRHDGSVGVVDPQTLFVDGPTWAFSDTIQDNSGPNMLDGDATLGHAVQGERMGWAIVDPSHPEITRGYMNVQTIFFERMNEADFRRRALNGFANVIHDEPEAIDLAGREGYLFSVRNPNQGLINFVVLFYENQVIQISSGQSARETRVLAYSIVESLP